MSIIILFLMYRYLRTYVLRSYGSVNCIVRLHHTGFADKYVHTYGTIQYVHDTHMYYTAPTVQYTVLYTYVLHIINMFNCYTYASSICRRCASLFRFPDHRFFGPRCRFTPTFPFTFRFEIGCLQYFCSVFKINNCLPFQKERN